jgi:tRNA(fMet)-specific endonuclease VapC
VTFLLDTNAFVDHLRRGPASNITQRLLATPPGSVYLCSVVLAELLFGAIRSGPLHEPANRAKIARLQTLFPTKPFDDDAAEEYAKLRAGLTLAGSLIGPNDLMIAAITMAAGATLVTHNTSEFSRVPGLILDDWQ